MKRVRIALLVGLPSLLAAWLPATSGANRVDRLGFLLAGVLIGFGSATLLAPWPWGERRPVAVPMAEVSEPAEAVVAAPETPAPPSTATLLAGLARTRAVGAPVPSLPTEPERVEPLLAVEPDVAPPVEAIEPTSDAPSVANAVEPEPVVEPEPELEPVVEWVEAVVGPERAIEPEPLVEWVVAVVEAGPAVEVEPLVEWGVDAVDAPTAPVATAEVPEPGAARDDVRPPVEAAPVAPEPVRAAKARASTPRARAAKSSPKGAGGANGARKRAARPATARAVPSPAPAIEAPEVAELPELPELRPVAEAVAAPTAEAADSDAAAPGVVVREIAEPALLEPEPEIAASDPAPEPEVAVTVTVVAEAPTLRAEPVLAPVAGRASTGATSIEEMVVARLAARSTSLDDLLRLTNGGEGRKATAPSAPPERTRTMPSAPSPVPRQSESIDDGLPASSIVERLARRAVGSSSGAWSLALADLTTSGNPDGSPSPDAARRATEAAVREALGATKPAAADGADDVPDSGARPVVGRLPDRR